MTVIEGEIDELEEMITESNQEPKEPKEATATIVVPAEIVRLVNLAPSGHLILSTCIDLAVFLAQKNISYGDSFMNPIRVFSTSDRIEQLLVRIDDKINRIQNRQDFEGDDDIKDLLGYLLLYFVARGQDEQQSGNEPSRTP